MIGELHHPGIDKVKEDLRNLSLDELRTCHGYLWQRFQEIKAIIEFKEKLEAQK